MSGLKPPELSQFYRSLHARGITTTVLADQLGVSRPALTRVLNGARRPGPIFRRAEAYLTEREMNLLRVAQTHSWNTKRIARRPTWNPLKLVA